MQGTIQFLHAWISTNSLVDDDRDFRFVDEINCDVWCSTLSPMTGYQVELVTYH
jgi:hypothetical protein